MERDTHKVNRQEQKSQEKLQIINLPETVRQLSSVPANLRNLAVSIVIYSKQRENDKIGCKCIG